MSEIKVRQTEANELLWFQVAIGPEFLRENPEMVIEMAVDHLRQSIRDWLEKES